MKDIGGDENVERGAGSLADERQERRDRGLLLVEEKKLEYLRRMCLYR
jgi:hypothetical protein